MQVNAGDPVDKLSPPHVSPQWIMSLTDAGGQGAVELGVIETPSESTILLRSTGVVSWCPVSRVPFSRDTMAVPTSARIVFRP